MGFDSGEDESHALRGTIDVTKLDAFRDAFTAIDPMASGEIADRLNPRELRLTKALNRYDTRSELHTAYHIASN